MSNRDGIILEKIIKYADETALTLQEYGDDFERIKASTTAKNALSMCVLQIGELASLLTDKFKDGHSAAPWRKMKAMRNIAAHNYGIFNVNLLWETVTEEIPELKKYCESILAQSETLSNL
jgi:uncharacterized protein with HEPN domain